MKTLLVIASKIELNKLQPLFEKGGYQLEQQSDQQYLLKKAGKEMQLLITGMGIANTIFSLTKYLTENKVKNIVNIGIGGAYPSSKLAIGEVAIISDDNYSDFGLTMEKSFNKLNEIHLNLNDYQKEITENKVEIKHKIELKMPDQKKYTAASGNTVSAISGDNFWAFRQEMIWKRQVESMEGAAVIDVANRFGLNCVQLRAISNIVGIQNKKLWDFENTFVNLYNVIDLNYDDFC